MKYYLISFRKSFPLKCKISKCIFIFQVFQYANSYEKINGRKFNQNAYLDLNIIDDDEPLVFCSGSERDAEWPVEGWQIDDYVARLQRLAVE